MLLERLLSFFSLFLVLQDVLNVCVCEHDVGNDVMCDVGNDVVCDVIDVVRLND